MKQLALLGTLVVVLGSVNLTRAILADGKPLASGTYQIRATDDGPTPGVGQSPGAELWVEFVKNGKVVGREVATVISAADMNAIAKGPRPRANGSRVETLKDGDYLRVWLNKAGTNYLINLPAAK